MGYTGRMSKLAPLSSLSGPAPGRRLERFIKQGRFDDVMGMVGHCQHPPTRAHGAYLARMLLDYLCVAKVPSEHEEAMGRYADAIVDGLLDAGAEANQMALAGVDPALMLAVNNGNLPVVRALLRRGADPNLTSRRDDSPSLAMIPKDDPDMAQALLAHGADPNAQAGWDGPMLWHAAAKGHTRIMAALVEHGADIHFIDDSGNTLAHHVVERAASQPIDLICPALHLALAWGVDPKPSNLAGHTVEDLAEASHERVALLGTIDAALAIRQAQTLDETTTGTVRARAPARL